MPFVRRIAVVLLAGVLAVRAGAQERTSYPYGSTLTFGTGLVNIPVAWVSPNSGDLFASISARALGAGTLQPNASNSLWQLTESLEAHVGGWLSVGGSLYSVSSQSLGLFAKALLVKQRDDGPRWLPSIAIGARNLGASQYVDRFVAGDRRVIDALPDSGRAAGLGKINGNPSLYLVMTRDFKYERNSASLSLGYGSGLFGNNGGLDTVYSKRGTLAKGLFFGGRLVIPAGTNSAVTLMLENDAWDWNFGALVTWGHVSAGLYLTELEETKGVPSGQPLANFTKSGLMFSYNASVSEIIHGSARRAEAAEAQLRGRRLQQEIDQRQARIRQLEVELAKAGVGAEKANAALAARLAKELEAQRQAVQAANDKLQKLPAKPKPEGER
jgi:hypothetical protein